MAPEVPAEGPLESVSLESPPTSPSPEDKRHSTVSAVSEASAASAVTADSGVSFEEVGFDDTAAWTEAPGAKLDRDLELDLGLGSPARGGFSISTHPLSPQPLSSTSGSGGSPRSERSYTASPARSERTVVGSLVRASMSSVTTSATNYTSSTGLGLTTSREDIPLVLGIAVVDFNHLVSAFCMPLTPDWSHGRIRLPTRSIGRYHSGRRAGAVIAVPRVAGRRTLERGGLLILCESLHRNLLTTALHLQPARRYAEERYPCQ